MKTGKTSEYEISLGYQFIHKDWSTRERPKKQQNISADHGTFRSTGWSAEDILSEAARIKDHCKHVKAPSPHHVVFGCDAMKVLELANDWADSVKAAKGRALQKNSPIMANGVISFPRDRESEWLVFREACVEYLKQKYGDRLKSVIEHQDETHPHIHYYLVPLHGLDEAGKVYSEDFGTVHEGYGASRATRKDFIAQNGKNAMNEKGVKYTKGAKTGGAFIDAMRELVQDDFQEKVAKHFGLARIGPRVQKLAHADAKRQNVERKVEADRLAAESARKRTEEVEFQMREIKRSFENDLAKKMKMMNAEISERQEMAEWEVTRTIEDGKVKALSDAAKIRRNAEVEAMHMKDVEIALIARDQNVALKVLAENNRIKSELSERVKELDLEKQAHNDEKLAHKKTQSNVEKWKAKFSAAKSILIQAVLKLNIFGNHEFDSILATSLEHQSDIASSLNDGKGGDVVGSHEDRRQARSGKSSLE